MSQAEVSSAPETTGAPEVLGTSGASNAPETTAVLEASGVPEMTESSVAGLGVDIIEIERMERALVRTPRIRERVFSEKERQYAQGKARPAIHFALFFAAKEAVLKALGTGFSGMAFTDVEVDHDRYGRPVPLLHGHAQEVAKAQGVVEMQLSLSYTHAVGVASAVAIKEQDRPQKDERVDPRVELARQFKEMRALLDDMDERMQALDEEDEQEVERENDQEDEREDEQEDEQEREREYEQEYKQEYEQEHERMDERETDRRDPEFAASSHLS